MFQGILDQFGSLIDHAELIDIPSDNDGESQANPIKPSGFKEDGLENSSVYKITPPVLEILSDDQSIQSDSHDGGNDTVGNLEYLKVDNVLLVRIN